MNILPHLSGMLRSKAAAKLNRSTTWDLSTLTAAEIRILKQP